MLVCCIKKCTWSSRHQRSTVSFWQEGTSHVKRSLNKTTELKDFHTSDRIMSGNWFFSYAKVSTYLRSLHPTVQWLFFSIVLSCCYGSYQNEKKKWTRGTSQRLSGLNNTSRPLWFLFHFILFILTAFRLCCCSSCLPTFSIYPNPPYSPNQSLSS